MRATGKSYELGRGLHDVTVEKIEPYKVDGKLTKLFGSFALAITLRADNKLKKVLKLPINRNSSGVKDIWKRFGRAIGVPELHNEQVHANDVIGRRLRLKITYEDGRQLLTFKKCKTEPTSNSSELF